MTVVFDANVGASASFWRGAPFDCLAAWAQGRCEAVVSAALLAEYHETIEELRLDYPHRKCAEWVEALTESAKLVFPVERASGATFDPDDEMVLECALAAGLSRVGQRRAGFAAAQFPPAPPARAATTRQRSCAGPKPPKTGSNCSNWRLPGSSSAGKMCAR